MPGVTCPECDYRIPEQDAAITAVLLAHHLSTHHNASMQPGASHHISSMQPGSSHSKQNSSPGSQSASPDSDHLYSTPPDSGTPPDSSTPPGSGTLPSSGTLHGSSTLNGSGTIHGSGTLPGSGTTQVSGTLPGSGTTHGSSTLHGSGTLHGSSTLHGSGTLPSSGTLHGSGTTHGSGLPLNSGILPGSGTPPGSTFISPHGYNLEMKGDDRNVSTTASELLNPNPDYIDQLKQRLRQKIRQGFHESQAVEFNQELEFYLQMPNVNVNSKWVDGNNISSLLFGTIEANNEKAVESILQHGADPNMTDKQGNAALHLAAKLGSVPITSILLRHNANIDATNKILNTPLLVAVRFSKLGVARELLKNRANVNYKMKSGWSLLHAAVNESSEAMVHLLCEYNADQNSPASSRKIDPTGGKMTPRQLAQMKGLDGMVAILENKAQQQHCLPGDGRIRGEWTNEAEEIMNMIMNGEDITEDLTQAVNNGPIDINASHLSRDVQYNLLFHAIVENQMEAVSNILTFHPDVNWRNDRGSSALQLAVKSGNEDMVKALLEYGALPDSANNLGMSALHVATRNNQLEMADLLVTNRANVNVRMTSGWTPLHSAVLTDNVDMVEMLVRHGADKTIKATNRKNFPDGRRINAKELAQSRGHQDIIRLLN